MNRKSAIATAGGLVASFAAGIAAVSFNWGMGATTQAAAPSPSPQKVKPIIKHRTITVHKKAPARPARGTIQLASMSSSPPVTQSGGSPSGGEGEDHEGRDD